MNNQDYKNYKFKINFFLLIHNINRDLNKTTYTMISKQITHITMYFWVFLDRLY